MFNKPTYVAFIFLLLIPIRIIYSQYGVGTFICIVTSPKHIIIAGDSREMLIRKGVAINSNKTCKIGFANGIGYTFAGIEKENYIKFNIRDICISATFYRGDLVDKMNFIKRIVEFPLKRIWKHDSTNKSAEVALFSFSKGKPEIIINRFFPEIKDKQINFSVINVVPFIWSSTHKVFFMGEVDSIYTKSKDVIIKNESRFLQPKFWVEYAIDHKFCKYCARPISILLCDSTGFHWVDSSHVCK